MRGIITPVLPHDLPENWTDNQYVTPGGTEAGLTEQHGFNYLMKQVNNSQKAINELNGEVRMASAELSSPGWYRVTRCSEEYSASFELSINTVCKNYLPTCCVVSVGSYWGSVSLNEKIVTSIGVISKLRVVYKTSGGGEYYVEAYYESDTSNVCQVTTRNFNHVIPNSTLEAVAFEPGSVPSGYSAVELELSYLPGHKVVDATVG